MGRLIVIEGLDGSGKNTLSGRIVEQVTAVGGRVRKLAFPRYDRSIFADLIRDGLYGRLGDLTDSVHGMALLFALDRRDAAAEIAEALRDNDIVLLDRYVSSNAAYGAARLGAPGTSAGDDFPEWIKNLEIERFGVPVPDRQLLLATPAHIAADRAAGRAATDEDRALDTFEADLALQHRTAAMYTRLAEQSYLSDWEVLTPGPDGTVAAPDVG